MPIISCQCANAVSWLLNIQIHETSISLLELPVEPAIFLFSIVLLPVSGPPTCTPIRPPHAVGLAQFLSQGRRMIKAERISHFAALDNPD